MANRIVDIGSRLHSAFGFVSTNLSGDLKKAGFDKSLKNAEVYIRDARTTFEELTLKGNGTTLKFGYVDFLKENSNVFAPPPMISFGKSKRIEETVLDGVDGEVIENYGHKPWDVKIQGLLIDMDNHLYPSGKVRQLIELFNYDGVWDVESKIFYDHKIKSIYFLDIDDSGVQGFEDTWSFTLTAKSIKPVEFFLKSK